ncbi:MAG: hypothetical protein ACTSO9_09005 [Candidatus Helarchaeota archaeon]
MEEEFDIKGDIESIKENITKKYFVCKQVCDKYQAKTKMEEKRLKSIKTMPGTEKKTKEGIEFKTKYIPYFILKGNYYISYLRRKKYTIPVGSDVKAIKIQDSIIDLEKMVRVKPNELDLDVIEKLNFVNQGEIFLDKDMNSINKKNIPYYDEIDENTYNEYASNKEIEESKYPENYFIEKLKELIIKRPNDTVRTLNETFEAEFDIILRPTYEGIFNYKGKIVKMTVDGVTGKSKMV